MNIFIRELKANFKSLLIWSGIVILFVYVGFSKFSAYYGNPELLVIFDNIPPAFLAAFNLTAFNLTTLTGFYGMMVTYFALLLAVAAAMWGSDIITKEERDKTVEYSLTLPVTREKMVTAKTLAAVVNCIALLLITWAITLFSSRNYGPDREYYNFLTLSMLAIFITQMIFLTAGIFLGCSMKQHKRVSSITVSLLLGTYFISVLSELSEDLEFLKYFSPFSYFNPATMLREAKIEFFFVGLSAAIVAVALMGAYMTYARRDLYI